MQLWPWKGLEFRTMGNNIRCTRVRLPTSHKVTFIKNSNRHENCTMPIRCHLWNIFYQINSNSFPAQPYHIPFIQYWHSSNLHHIILFETMCHHPPPSPPPPPSSMYNTQNKNSLTFQAISVFPRMSDRKYICFHDWWPLGNSAPCPEHCCVGASHLCPGKSGR